MFNLSEHELQLVFIGFMLGAMFSGLAWIACRHHFNLMLASYKLDFIDEVNDTRRQALNTSLLDVVQDYQNLPPNMNTSMRQWEDVFKRPHEQQTS